MRVLPAILTGLAGSGFVRIGTLSPALAFPMALFATVPELVEVEVSAHEPTPPPEESAAPEADAREDMPPPDQTQPPAPTVQPDHPATTPDPESILDILKEE